MFGCTGGLAAQLLLECHQFRERPAQRWGSSEIVLIQIAEALTRAGANGDVPSFGLPIGITEWTLKPRMGERKQGVRKVSKANGKIAQKHDLSVLRTANASQPS